MKSLVLSCLLVLLAWPSAVAAQDPSAPAPAEARAVVESFHEALLASMREGKELGFQGRYERMLVALDAGFDMPFMARAALGPTWKDLTPEQHTQFVDLSRRLSAARYADNFDSYGKQRFETKSEKPAARGTMLVMTEMVQPEDRNVTFDYRLRDVQGRWRVIDVHLDGMVSELAVRRSQYRSLAEREGYDHLVEVIEKKIAELASE